MPMTECSKTRVRVLGVRLFFRRLVQFFVLLAFGSSGTVLCAQTVEITLVNGRNGRPMAGACVNVWVGHERKAAMAIPTDENGVARLRLTDKDGEIDIHDRWKDCGDFGMINPVVKYNESLRINAGYVSCQSRTPDHSWLAVTDLSTKEVLQHGFATANTCGKATASPRPGEVILFVRSLSWWEKLKQ
jgi:hypothetical protein